MSSLDTRVVGSQLPNMSITWADENGVTRTLTGTITGNMTNISTGVTRAITGTLTPDADQVTNKGVFSWDLSAADVETVGLWIVNFIETVSGKDYYSLTLYWSIAPTAAP